jgi:carbamoyl-phosphate synthase small subunit
VRSLDPNVKMNPPLRAEEDRQALVEALKDGTIEAIATDHAPHARHEKDVPFEEAPFGVTGLETAFSVLYTRLVEPGSLSLAALIDRMSAGRRRIYGLERRDRVGRPRTSSCSTSSRPGASRERLQVALAELLAPRPDLKGKVVETVATESSRTQRRCRPVLRYQARAALRTGASRRPRRIRSFQRRRSGVLASRGSRGACRDCSDVTVTGFLVLEDGSVFRGDRSARTSVAFGEAVFTTAMTGYQEIVTDPSYAEQLVCFTAPMVGNYGVVADALESRPRTRGACSCAGDGAEWPRWLPAQGIVALEEIDTRALVFGSRRAGDAAARGRRRRIGRGGARQVRTQAGMEGRALVAGVSTETPYTVGAEPSRSASSTTAASARSSSARCRGARVTVYPHSTRRDTLLARARRRVLSNGPGDPAAFAERGRRRRELIGRVPLLGICLGHQLLALAAGIETFKLPFGHRGANHPVLDCARTACSSRARTTASRSRRRPEVAHVSLYDGTVEGLSLPASARARCSSIRRRAGPARRRP